MRKVIKGSVDSLSRKMEKCVRETLEGEEIEGVEKRTLVVMFTIQEYYYLKGQIIPNVKIANAYNTLADALKGIMLEEFEKSFGTDRQKAEEKLREINENYANAAPAVKEEERKEKADESAENDPVKIFAQKYEKVCENMMKGALAGKKGDLGDFGENLLSRARGLCAYYAVMEIYEEDAKKKEKNGKMKKDLKDICMMMYGDNYKMGMQEALQKMEKVDKQVFEKIIYGFKVGK